MGLCPFCQVAFDVLGSSPEGRIQAYKLTRVIMHLGFRKFKQKPGEEQAEGRTWRQVKILCLVTANQDKASRLRAQPVH